MKIGFLGGSFDPVHFGHLIVAQDAYEQLGLDRLYWVPAAQAPLKPREAQASPADRLAMLQAAIAGDARFEVTDFELRRGGVSYTIDSVEHFRRQFPEDRLFWIVGADQVPSLPRWRRIEDLVKLVEFVFLDRPGHSLEEAPAIPGLRLHRVRGHQVEISSTELRERTRKGLPLDYFLPHKVSLHIQQHRLYQSLWRNQ